MYTRLYKTSKALVNTCTERVSNVANHNKYMPHEAIHRHYTVKMYENIGSILTLTEFLQ